MLPPIEVKTEPIKNPPPAKNIVITATERSSTDCDNL